MNNPGFEEKAWNPDPNGYPDTVGIYRLPLRFLSDEFKFSESAQYQVSRLRELNFTHYRKSRGDGNCYYRAVMVTFLEYKIRRKELNNFYSDLMNAQGYFQRF
jgi:ubiquitin thioesterase protein OTUB1